MKIKSFFPFSLLLIILLVFTACSSDDDFGEAIPKEQVINYFPLSTGNEWEYLNKEKIADESLSEEIEWLRVSDSIDRKSTRLNSSHVSISYAVFSLKKKNKNKRRT